MLLWQCYSYDQGRKMAAITHPQQEHFYFFPSNAAPVAPTPAHRDGADVQQVGYTVQKDTPGTGSMTCHVTLKNEGNAKAVGIQIMVRPYRGVSNFDEDASSQQNIVVSDDDPLSKFGQWITFPDLAPGESNTQSVVFTSRTDFKPGVNPTPTILFQTEKAKAKP